MSLSLEEKEVLRVVLPLLGNLLKLLGVNDDGEDDDVITRLLLCVGVGCDIGSCCCDCCDGRCEAGVELRLLLPPAPPL